MGKILILITSVCKKSESWMKRQVQGAAFEQVFLIKVYVGREAPFKFFFIE